VDIQTRKIHFVQKFLRVADDEVITKLKDLLRIERKKKLEKEISSMTMNKLEGIL